ncbi:unnamed protein product [Effrenium voratum]|uniref:Uncharacterized protein n=1 Tax=Effrenium voratum TaxID=2562239 RepID=A0AA36HR15_9DINO|nr:unnamed protein product [Effrenium voratum]CAJ1421680.1 unnamed protein product [Effrenium voratum]
MAWTTPGIWSPGVGMAPAPYLEAPPAQGELTQLLTEVARQREEAAQLRLRVMQSPSKHREQLGEDLRAQTLNWQPPVHKVKEVNHTVEEVRSRIASLRDTLEQAQPEHVCHWPSAPPEEKPRKTRKASPRTKAPTRSEKREKMEPVTERLTRANVSRRSRPNSPNTSTSLRSVSPSSNPSAPRLCTSVPEHRLKPPEPQFLFSLPLRVYEGPKKLVDLTFKGKESRSGSPPTSPTATQSESARSFMWTQDPPARAYQVHERAPVQGPGAKLMELRPMSSGVPASTQGLSTPASPRSVAGMPAPNFTWNAPMVAQMPRSMSPQPASNGYGRSISPPPAVQYRSISPPPVPQVRYMSPPLVGR